LGYPKKDVLLDVGALPKRLWLLHHYGVCLGSVTVTVTVIPTIKIHHFEIQQYMF